MPTFMCQVNLNAEACRGTVKDTAVKRRALIEGLLAKTCGQLKAYYYALGDVDVYAIAECPDALAATAMSLAINSSGGGVSLRLVPLLSCEEVDAAAQRMPSYRGPGQ